MADAPSSGHPTVEISRYGGGFVAIHSPDQILDPPELAADQEGEKRERAARPPFVCVLVDGVEIRTRFTDAAALRAAVAEKLERVARRSADGGR